jgi:signal transduction histidine kinase
MADFKRIFPFVVLLSLLVVLLLSIRQIRSSLVPLERLKAGTRRIAKRDFASPVKVRSGDDFEELANSFNTMASQLGRQFKSLATMAEIDRAILSALDTEKIVETVLARLRDVFPSDYVSVTLFDDNGKYRARTYLSEGIPNRATQMEDIQLDPDEVRPLFDHSDGVCIADGKIPNPLAPFARPGIQSLLVLPIVLKQGLCGIVALGHFRPASYSQDDMIQARQLADQVAVALSNAYTIAERKRAKEELQKNLQRLVALRDIDLAVTSTLDLDTILDFLLRKIDLLLPHSATTVWLMNKNEGGPIPVAHRNLDMDDWDTKEFEAWGGVPCAVFETKATVHISNLHKALRLGDQEFFHENGLVTYLGVPLVAKGEFLGALSVYIKKEHAFSDEEVDFNIIISFKEYMREGMYGRLTKKQCDTLKKVAKQSGHLLTMINTLMDTTGLETEGFKVEIETFSLGELLEEIRSTYDFPLNNGLTLEWNIPTEPIIMKTDRRRINLILQHLIDNAIKFTEEGQVTISVRMVPTKETVEFKVMDTGIGIPTEAFPVIFDKLVQWDSSETRCYGGVGLGLYVVKAFTELLRGRVEVESQPGEGSTFTVDLPVDYHGAKGAGPGSKGEENGPLKRESTGRQISAAV